MTTLSQAATILSKAGASKGGIARREKLSPARRQEIARGAATARWAGTRPRVKGKG